MRRTSEVRRTFEMKGKHATSLSLADKAAGYLNRLCHEIPGRRVGQPGNRAATDWFAATVASFGFAAESPAFDCIDWTQAGADLVVDGVAYPAQVSPYSLPLQGVGPGGRFEAPLAVVSTVDELETAQVAGGILLLRSEIAREQLMPKGFTFYNPESHQRIIRLLESARPAAIIAATSHNPELAGGVSPFPLIEDGDFDIPSVYLTEEVGDELARLAGPCGTPGSTPVQLAIRARRIPARGCNVVARRGRHPGRRLAFLAHIDAKEGTPGAIDNATGVVTLLLLAELLADYAGELAVEIVALNGEDYYASSGEMLYLASNAGRFDEFLLGVNIDGAGYHRGKTAYSLYDCPPDLAATIDRVLGAHRELIEGDPWYQSDHSLFLMNQRPALAITSERFSELWAGIAHTPRDRPDIVDPAKLAALAVALRDLTLALARPPGA